VLQDQATTEYKYELFQQRVVDTEQVWGLANDEGWATSSSNDNNVTVIPFWSDKAYALACAKQDWSTYRPTSIPLNEFLESWCIGMISDGTLVGVNWDSNMFGKEVEPLDLALDILKELTTKGKSISFQEFEDLDEYMTEIKNASH
jgi:hypothetical protein